MPFEYVPNAAHAIQESAKLPPALPGTRHITMFTDDTHENTIIKFSNVPDAYDLASIKHADHAGMLWTFNNGETWLVMYDARKRLFQVPNFGDIDPCAEEGEDDGDEEDEDEDVEDAGEVEDWPLMEPEELIEALKKMTPYEEMVAMLEAAEKRRREAIERGEVVEECSVKTNDKENA